MLLPLPVPLALPLLAKPQRPQLPRKALALLLKALALPRQNNPMIKRLFILAAFYVMGITIAAAQDFPFLGTVTEEGINVRAGSNVNYESLFKAAKGAKVIVRGKSYNWYRISLPEGAQCFVSAKYVKRLNADIGQIVADRVNVRAKPDESHTILGQLRKGQAIVIRERLNDWLAISPPDNCFGWIHEKFLRFDSPFVEPTKVESVKSPRQIEASVEEPKAIVSVATEAASPVSFEVVGVVAPRGKLLFKRRGSHKLLIDKKPAYYLEGDRNLLDRFINLKVKVSGVIEDSRADLPLIKVLSIAVN